jgi:putative isomerase
VANLDACLTTAAPAGNLLCLQNAFEDWVDRSQPPLAGYVLCKIFQLTGDRGLLTRYLAPVIRAHEWWFSNRRSTHGLLAYGSSPTGTGAFVHSRQGAIDESSMNNLPAFDESSFDDIAHTLDLVEPGLNSLVSLEGQLLAQLVRVSGDDIHADRLQTRAADLNQAITERLWDEPRGLFNGRLASGPFVRSLAPTGFFPLLAGAGTDAQIRVLLRTLTDPATFWRDRVLPASTFDDPASTDDVYWRGRIWPPVLFLVWEGLRRQGIQDLAAQLGDHAWDMFVAEWRSERACRENYHREDPARDAGPDSDPFYAWGALLPLMRMLDGADVSLWEGPVFAPTDEPAWLAEGGRLWVATRDESGMTVRADGRVVALARSTKRLRIRIADTSVRLGADGDSADGQLDVTMPWLPVDRVRAIEGTGVDLQPAEPSGVRVTVPWGTTATLWITPDLTPVADRVSSLPPRLMP